MKNMKYGIEITKPFSKEMYNHNDMVAEEMKANLLHHWNQIIKRMEDDDKWTLDREWDEDEIKAPKSKGGYGFPELVKLQRGVCYSGFGSGYTIQDVQDEFINEWLEIKREGGFKLLLQKKGWYVILAIVTYYLIRDSILYILIPHLIYKGYFS